jgi:hypothetical protein
MRRMQTVKDVVSCGAVIASLPEVTAALAAMDLTLKVLHRAMDAGEVDRDSCTANNPPTDGPSRAHGTTVRVLREQKIPDGWAACDDRNFCTVVSPDEEMEIAVASGDEATGNPEGFPRTKNAKGELVFLGIERNVRQFKLIQLPPVARVQKRSAKTTWILLRYRRPDQDVLRSELSLPIGMGDDDRVEEWGTRIILPDLVLGGPGRGIRIPDVDVGQDIDVNVVRRSA